MPKAAETARLQAHYDKTGRKYGAKSKEMRKWMLDSKNYVYEYFSTNRSKGSILGKSTTYLPDATK